MRPKILAQTSYITVEWRVSWKKEIGWFLRFYDGQDKQIGELQSPVQYQSFSDALHSIDYTLDRYLTATHLPRPVIFRCEL